jgi:hypothetical protein
MSEKETPQKPEKKSSKYKWIAGAVGLASAAVLGFVVTKKVLDKRKPAQPLRPRVGGDWKLIDRIDAALGKADIEGIEVFLNKNKAVLISGQNNLENLNAAKKIISAIDGITEVETIVK